MCQMKEQDITLEKELDLRIWGGGGVRCDRVRECHGHIYTTKCKIDSEWEAAT